MCDKHYKPSRNKCILFLPAQMEYVILAVYASSCALLSLLDKSAIYVLVVMTSLDATQAVYFIRQQSKLILQIILV